MTPPYINTNAKTWTYNPTSDVSLAQNFHRRLPNYSRTPLVPLPSLAHELNIRAVYAKDETQRMGLPAFKILGASWGSFRAIAAHTNLSLTATLEDLSLAARAAGLSLFAATSGNHGRAIAHMARILGIPAVIFLAHDPDQQVLDNIAAEGARTVVVQGDYDAAVAETVRVARCTPGALHVQDYSWAGYEEIAGWVVDGYSMMMREMEEQLGLQTECQGSGQIASGVLKATHIVVPIGAGSLGLAVVAHAKSDGRAVRVVAVEPETSPCLHENLKRCDERLGAESVAIPIPTTGDTIMTGLICANVNRISWPVLREGVDVSVTISDVECHAAVEWLRAHGVDAGPCGGATLAGLWSVAGGGEAERAAAGLDQSSVVVLLCTEGKRFYRVPGEGEGKTWSEHGAAT